MSDMSSMNYAIEIVQAMYDEAEQEYVKTPLYNEKNVELVTRIDTLTQVLHKLNNARKEEDDGLKNLMNLESLILNVCEMKNTYRKRFDKLSIQKGDAAGKLLQKLSVLHGAICALDQVLELVDKAKKGD